jgi:hypothetical protein
MILILSIATCILLGFIVKDILSAIRMDHDLTQETGEDDESRV